MKPTFICISNWQAHFQISRMSLQAEGKGRRQPSFFFPGPLFPLRQELALTSPGLEEAANWTKLSLLHLEKCSPLLPLRLCALHNFEDTIHIVCDVNWTLWIVQITLFHQDFWYSHSPLSSRRPFYKTDISRTALFEAEMWVYSSPRLVFLLPSANSCSDSSWYL